MLSLEQRAIDAFVKLGVVMTNTCINYQTIQAPARNEHVAYGDTGVVIYSNSICGARSNFEGGPSALAAGLTGRTPRYGFHLPEKRSGTLYIRVEFTPESLNEWGALGGAIGRIAGNYWNVPVIEGVEGAPGSDQLSRGRSRPREIHVPIDSGSRQTSLRQGGLTAKALSSAEATGSAGISTRSSARIARLSPISGAVVPAWLPVAT